MSPDLRLALGSNIGDREGHLADARELIAAILMQEMDASPVEETAAIGPPQGPYLNQVLRGISRLQDPLELLDECQKAERMLGRKRGERWGPRIIDIDILTLGTVQEHQPGLDLPHPRIRERMFVLSPWAKLEPDFQIPPGQETVQQLLDQLRSQQLEESSR
jgi:2-amino-4-hydroxy-6-hydroxymethyldihydropteridine diphosphokinase